MSLLFITINILIVIGSIIALILFRRAGREWSDARVIVSTVVASISMIVSLVSAIRISRQSSLSLSSTKEEGGMGFRSYLPPSLSRRTPSYSQSQFSAPLSDDQASDRQSELLSEWEALQESKSYRLKLEEQIEDYKREDRLIREFTALYQHPLFRHLNFQQDLKSYQLTHNQFFASFPSSHHRFLISYLRSPIHTRV